MEDRMILKRYLRDLSKHPLLTRKEEIELSKQIKNGDQKALDKMVNCNLKLVIKISKEFKKGNQSFVDIIQNGNIGLIKAAQKFDHEKGVKFSTYASFWIRQSILRGFIKPSSDVSISYRKDFMNKSIKNFILDYYKEKRKLPSLEYIQKNLKVKRRDALDVLLMFRNNGDYSYTKNVIRIDDGILPNIADDSYNPDNLVQERIVQEEVMDVLVKYSEREREIILKRFGFGTDKKETLQKIGEKYSITSEAVRQIEKKVLLNMRQNYPSLQDYCYAS